MALPALGYTRIIESAIASQTIVWGRRARYQRIPRRQDQRYFATQEPSKKPSPSPSNAPSLPQSTVASAAASEKSSASSSAWPEGSTANLSAAWEKDEYAQIENFSQLPSKDFGKNQLIETNEEFKRALRQILRQFPHISHAFAYGSGVFPQSDGSTTRVTLSPHPHPPEAILKWQKGGGKMIDFIFATTFSEHFHSLNMHRHRDHYSMLASLGSGFVSYVQDNFGAGAYFNPYINVNGTLIKYGVVNLQTLYRDLTDWDTLYLAGRLHKPVKILYEDPNIRLANQRNLMAAVRCSLLMLPQTFTENDLYTTIASLSYTGDPRMSIGSEHPHKVANIVNHQLRPFRQLYTSIFCELPNICYADPRVKSASPNWESLPHTSDIKMEQNMDPAFRGNMVRRLPKAFREKLYFLYQRKFGIPGKEFQEMLAQSKDEDAKGSVRKPLGTSFDRRIATEPDLKDKVRQAVKQTVQWPSTVQSIKSFFTAGVSRSIRYIREKAEKGRQGSASS